MLGEMSISSATAVPSLCAGCGRSMGATAGAAGPVDFGAATGTGALRPHPASVTTERAASASPRLVGRAVARLTALEWIFRLTNGGMAITGRQSPAKDRARTRLLHLVQSLHQVIRRQLAQKGGDF